MESSRNRSRCYVPHRNYYPSHVRALTRGSISRADPASQKTQWLTSYSTIEEQIGLLCTCMPFFPAIVKRSPILQKFIQSVASLGSIWTLRSSRHSSATDARRSYQKHVSSCDGSVEDGVELQGQETFTEIVLPDSPKKVPRPRIEPAGFRGDERPKLPYTKL